MKDTDRIMKHASLFRGIGKDERKKLRKRLKMKTRKYETGATVLRRGDNIRSVCILVSGSLLIQSDDYWGRRNILSVITPGDIFGEAYAMNGTPLMDNVTAAADSEIVFIDIESMIGSGSPVLIENLFSLIAGKNISLVRKLKYMTCPTIREKLMAYLSDEAEKHGSEEFLIPFSREELASFLSVDRCALSRELGKMRDDGLLEFRRNRFHLSENRG